MIRKVASITLHVIAGFFFYMVSLLAFVNELTTSQKLWLLFGFTVPAMIFLCGGLALTKFHSWKRDTGIVLLSASGFTAFLMLSLAYFFTLEDFRKMVQPETIGFLSDYSTGAILVVGFAVLGLVLLKTDKNVEATRT